MVTLVWFILSLFKVCSFSWWPVFIEGIIAVFVFAIGSDSDGAVLTGPASIFSMGVVAFAGLKLFCGLTISPWWMLIAGIWLFIAVFFPGGFTLTYLWFDHLNVITYSKGQLIFLIIIDVLMVVGIVYGIINSVIEKQKKRKK